MGKLFSYKNDFGTSSLAHRIDCSLLWRYLNDVGYPKFESSELFHLYSTFSSEITNSETDWLEVNATNMEDFAEWLSWR